MTSLISIISLSVALISTTATVMIAYFRWKYVSEKAFSERVEKVIDEYMDKHLRDYLKREMTSDEVQKVIQQAVDNSDLSKKIDRLILILCSNDNDLRHTSLCQGS